MVLRITVFSDSATPFMDRLGRRLLDPRARKRFLTQFGAKTSRQAKLNARAKGGRRFWKEMSRSINLVDVDSRSATVEATHVAAAQKEFGGRITAKGRAAGGADFLAFGISGTEAEGRSTYDFLGRDLVPLGLDDGSGVLAEVDENENIYPLFVLTRSVDQKADPFMPDEKAVRRIGERCADQALTRLFSRN